MSFGLFSVRVDNAIRENNGWQDRRDCDEITFDIIFLKLENLQSSKVSREKGRKDVEIFFSIFCIEVWKSLKIINFIS